MIAPRVLALLARVRRLERMRHCPRGAIWRTRLPGRDGAGRCSARGDWIAPVRGARGVPRSDSLRGLGFPLDGAAHGVGVCGGDGLVGEDRGEGVAQVVVLRCGGLFPVVVNPAFVGDFSVLDDEEVGSADGAVGAGGFLGGIVEVGEVEAALGGAELHVFEAVVGIGLFIVGVDGGECNALGRVFAHDGHEAVFVGFGVGAVVAGEVQDECATAGESVECVGFSVCSEEREVGGGCADGEGVGTALCDENHGSLCSF